MKSAKKDAHTVYLWNNASSALQAIFLAHKVNVSNAHHLACTAYKIIIAMPVQLPTILKKGTVCSALLPVKHVHSLLPMTLLSLSIHAQLVNQINMLHSKANAYCVMMFRNMLDA